MPGPAPEPGYVEVTGHDIYPIPAGPDGVIAIYSALDALEQRRRQINADIRALHAELRRRQKSCRSATLLTGEGTAAVIEFPGGHRP